MDRSEDVEGIKLILYYKRYKINVTDEIQAKLLFDVTVLIKIKIIYIYSDKHINSSALGHV